MFADSAAMLSALAIGTYVAGHFGEVGMGTWQRTAPSAVGALFLVLLSGRLYPGVGLTGVVESYRCMLLSSLLAGVAILLNWALLANQSHIMILLGIAWLGLLLLLPVTRQLTRRICSGMTWWCQPLLVLGDPDNPKVRETLAQFIEHPWWGLAPRATLDYPSPPWFARRMGQDGAMVETRDVYRAIVLFSDEDRAVVERVLEYTTQRFPYVFVVPGTSPDQIPLACNNTWTVSGACGYEVRNRLISPIAQLIKRMTDMIVAIIALLVLSPLFVITAVALKVMAPGPVFYSQVRVGRNGIPFKTWKFRTMFVDAEKRLYEYLAHDPELIAQWERQRKVTNDPRVIPRIGRFLRTTSIDELPQLWNVLRGEMSLVGPRPLPEYHLGHFSDMFRAYRQQVLPGITGLWQVTSRIGGHDEDYIRCDSYYIRNWSLTLDWLILWRTLRAVYLGGGEGSQ